jgi:hypothetical protein
MHAANEGICLSDNNRGGQNVFTPDAREFPHASEGKRFKILAPKAEWLLPIFTLLPFVKTCRWDKAPPSGKRLSEQRELMDGLGSCVDVGDLRLLWGVPRENPYDYLKALQPTLVVNGGADVIIYSVNSFILQQHIPNAQLILYPDANHGSQYQYPELFVRHVSMFLSGQDRAAEREARQSSERVKPCQSRSCRRQRPSRFQGRIIRSPSSTIPTELWSRSRAVSWPIRGTRR